MNFYPWASYQIGKLADAHAPGMPGTFFPPPRVGDTDMHHGTCVTHVPWCMPGSLTSSFIWRRRRGKTFPAFPTHDFTYLVRGPLFRMRSWNNGVRCMSFCILLATWWCKEWDISSHGIGLFPSECSTLRWRHTGCDSVSNHQPHGCLLNRLFRHRSKKTSKLRVTDVVREIHKGASNTELFPFGAVIMRNQRANLKWPGSFTNSDTYKILNGIHGGSIDQKRVLYQPYWWYGCNIYVKNEFGWRQLMKSTLTSHHNLNQWINRAISNRPVSQMRVLLVTCHEIGAICFWTLNVISFNPCPIYWSRDPEFLYSYCPNSRWW